MSKYKVQIDLLTRYVESSKGFICNRGLCQGCELNLVDIRVANKMFASWDEFSGCIAYPVKSPEKDGPFVFYVLCHNMHDRRTKYGKARLSLAKHCLKYLQTLENENE